MDVVFAFVLEGRWKFHGEAVETVMCQNRLRELFDTSFKKSGPK